METQENRKEAFPFLKKDLLTILVVLIIIVASFAYVKSLDNKTNFLAKISEKISSKYIK